MRIKLIIISVLLVGLVAACQSRGGNKVPNPPSGAKSASQLQMVGNQSAFVEETQLLSLSPDGKWFFGLGQGTICIYAADALAEKVCSNWNTTLDPNSIAWSPDSTRVAFTENLNALTESDIWVFDIQSGGLNDITNDNLEGDLSTSLQRAKTSTKDINLDSMPVWSPDGKTLAFVRSSYGDTQQTTICLIPPAGGEVIKLIIADEQHSLAVWHAMRWTPDGNKILFNIIVLEDTSGKNGIWIVDKNGKNSRQLVKEKEGWGYPALYDVSVKGDRALIGYPRALVRADKNPNLCFYEILDLKTGNLTPLIQPPVGTDQPSDQPVYYSPTQVAFSPDGTKILYQYNKAGSDQPIPQLVVRDVNGTTEQLLDNKLIYLGEDVGPTLFWAQNDTIYLMTGPGLGILYTLGSK